MWISISGESCIDAASLLTYVCNWFWSIRPLVLITNDNLLTSLPVAFMYRRGNPKPARRRKRGNSLGTWTGVSLIRARRRFFAVETTSLSLFFSLFSFVLWISLLFFLFPFFFERSENLEEREKKKSVKRKDLKIIHSSL